jgi:tRNA threonylcarbamoyladenosine biosynthesis protein TsaB
VRSPPLLLAFETATRAASVALLRGAELLAERMAPRDRTTAEALLPALDALLTEAGVPLATIDAFAVSIGPGSFTGLRVGIATVKGLAFGTGRPVAPVPTLAALAGTAGAPREAVIALLDARRGEVYAAGYAPTSAGPWGREILPEGVYTAEALAARLPPACLLVGDGVAVCGERLRERRGAGVEVQPPSEREPRARHVGALGAAILAAGGGIDAAAVAPRYLRRAEAEVKRTGVRFESGPPSGAGSAGRSADG